MKKDDLSPIVIDFAKLRKIDEGLGIFLKTWVSRILRMLLGDNIAIPVKIKGSAAEVRSFIAAMGNEKSYVEAYRMHGLDDPKTYRTKSKLRSSVSDFERTTGVKWPFDH
jgi:hypothetical protein